jgi:chondroitin AC lyase
MLVYMRRIKPAIRTGSNLDDELLTQIKTGCVTRNKSLVASGFASFWDELRVSPPVSTNRTRAGDLTDGIQIDHSFHQHGAELLAGSYGADFVKRTLTAIDLSKETRFAPTNDAAMLLVDLVLDGMRWMTINRNWDWSARGRDLGAPGYVDFGTANLSSVLRDLAPNRTKELRAFDLAIAGGVVGDDARLLGHRGFWATDYAVMRSISSQSGVRWIASVRMHSNRTVSARCVNEQAKISEHTADGLVMLYYTGDEYTDVFPLWGDWTSLPGVTAEAIPVQSCEYEWQLGNDSAKMTRTGTVSNGKEGLSSMALVSHNLTALKSIALLKHAVVSLIADLRCNSSNAVLTTLASRISSTDTNVSFATTTTTTLNDQPQQQQTMIQTLPFGTTINVTIDHVNWLWHNGTGYIFLSDSGGRSVIVTNAIRNGTWSRVGTSNSWVAKPLFEVKTPHSRPQQASPEQLDSIAFVLLPGVALRDMTALFSTHAHVEVVANTNAVQAITNAKTGAMMATFWEVGEQNVAVFPQTARAAKPLRVSVDRVAIVLLEIKHQALTVTVSDPTNGAGPRGSDDLVVTLLGLAHGLLGTGCTNAGAAGSRMVIIMPLGWSAGQSVSRTCEMVQ